MVRRSGALFRHADDDETLTRRRQIEEAIGVADRLGLIRPSVEQPQYSMLERTKVDRDFLDIFAKYKYGTTIWSPLASGSVSPFVSIPRTRRLTILRRSLLTGKYNDGIPAGSRFDTSKAFFNDTVEKLRTPEGQAKIAKVKAITTIATRIGATPTTLALAWCAKNPNVTTVILGASKPDQIVENLKALEVIPLLTEEIMREIEEVLQNKPELATTYGR